ncbi:AAA family ATPase [Bacillus cereus]
MSQLISFNRVIKKLIQVEKKYFNKYWIDNIPKKQFRLDKHRDEELKQLELIYEQIKEVFFDDIVVDFRINAIGFKDYRCFKDEKFKFNKQSTVLLGKNASGKTTLLDGIAVAIGGFFKWY